MKALSISALSVAAIIGASFLSADSAAPAAAALQPDKVAQDAMTPDTVLADLKAGNKRYAADQLSNPDLKPRIAKATEGQFPKAYILSCVDSRVPAEQVFDQRIGDVFVGRVAGNIENDDQLGSMEYAAAAAGIKLIVVMGHESCGAVKGACDNVQLGNLSALLQKIRPAVRSVEGNADKTSKDKAFVAEVVKNNVKMTVADIRTRSEVLADMEKAGKIKIVGAYYSLKTGEVTFL